MPRFNATATRRRNRAAVEQALAEQRDVFREDYTRLVEQHRQDLARSRRVIEAGLIDAAKLHAMLDALEQENRELRVALAELRTFQQIAQWRRNRIVSWRGWWSVAQRED